MGNELKNLLANKIALITGASRGIGNAVAKRYIDEGAHVIAVGRSLKKLEELDDYAKAKGSHITIAQLDLRESEKIFQLAKVIQQKFSRLDIFIAAAAMLGEVTPLNHYNPKIWEDVIKVNFTANWYFIRYLTHLLQKSESGGRVVFVTCNMSENHKAYWGAYASSKAALEKLAEIYAEEEASTKTRIRVVNPGAVDTALRKNAFPGQDRSSLARPEEITDLFVESVIDDIA